MKRIITITAVLLVLIFGMVNAADVIVAPGLNTLANAVNASQAGDVLILSRDGVYGNQGIIQVSVPITIKAADGTGNRPFIVVVADASGAYAGSTFQLFASTTFENLAFTGIRDASRTARIGQMFQASATRLRIVMDGCTLVGFGGRTLEPGRDSCVVIIRNCMETGNGRSNRVDNGRFIDCRNAGLDTLILQNNTLLNCADRWIRHMAEPQHTLGYVLFDHNTFMNGTGYRPSFQWRNVRELYFTNNLVVNPSILGTTIAGVRKDEVEYTEPLAICTFTITRADTTNEVLVMKNNNVYKDPRIDAILNLPGDSVEVAPWFNKQFEDRIDPLTAFFSEPLTFVQDVTIDSILPELEIYVGGTKGYSHAAFIWRTDEQATGVDMNYGTTAQSYTAATGGFPLGDLNWYPDKKAEWETWITAVEKNRAEQPGDFALSQNYPNPFNPATTIDYRLSKMADVEMSIYNMMGQKVRTLVQENQTAGTYKVTWDGRSDDGISQTSGVYFCKLNAGRESFSRKMLMVK